jgi:hypothetical protein
MHLDFLELALQTAPVSDERLMVLTPYLFSTFHGQFVQISAEW